MKGLAVITFFVALPLAASGPPAEREQTFINGVSRPTRNFYERVGRNCQSEFTEIQGAIARSYETRDYTVEEFDEALRALQHGADSKRAHFGTLAYRDGEPKLDIGHESNVLVVYVDPVCEECARVMRVILDARNRQSRFPPVAFRVLPNPHEESRQAAVLLEYIRLENPDDYTPAVIDALQTIPNGSGTLESVASAYLSRKPDRGSTRWRAAEKRVDLTSQEASIVTVGAPFGIYRGRVLTRMRPQKIPFDVFRDADSLVLTLAAIDVSSGAADGCKRLKRKRSL